MDQSYVRRLCVALDLYALHICCFGSEEDLFTFMESKTW